MNWGYLSLIAFSFSMLLIITQRVHPRKRHIVRGFVISMGILLMIRYEFLLENIIGYVIAAFISFLYWILIGRYNEVEDKDDIKVYGMND